VARSCKYSSEPPGSGARELVIVSFLLKNVQDYVSFTKKKQSSPATRHGGSWAESSYAFMTSALDGGEWSASRPGRALPWERTPGTHCTGGSVDLRAGLDTQAR
jgi:hypothetical protein